VWKARISQKPLDFANAKLLYEAALQTGPEEIQGKDGFSAPSNDELTQSWQVIEDAESHQNYARMFAEWDTIGSVHPWADTQLARYIRRRMLSANEDAAVAVVEYYHAMQGLIAEALDIPRIYSDKDDQKDAFMYMAGKRAQLLKSMYSTLKEELLGVHVRKGGGIIKSGPRSEKLICGISIQEENNFVSTKTASGAYGIVSIGTLNGSPAVLKRMLEVDRDNDKMVGDFVQESINHILLSSPSVRAAVESVRVRDGWRPSMFPIPEVLWLARYEMKGKKEDPILFMEAMDDTLATLLLQSPLTLNAGQLLDILLQVVEKIALLQDSIQFMHRDLNGSNVMVRRRPVPIMVEHKMPGVEDVPAFALESAYEVAFIDMAMACADLTECTECVGLRVYVNGGTPARTNDEFGAVCTNQAYDLMYLFASMTGYTEDHTLAALGDARITRMFDERLLQAVRENAKECVVKDDPNQTFLKFAVSDALVTCDPPEWRPRELFSYMAQVWLDGEDPNDGLLEAQEAKEAAEKEHQRQIDALKSQTTVDFQCYEDDLWIKQEQYGVAQLKAAHAYFEARLCDLRQRAYFIHLDVDNITRITGINEAFAARSMLWGGPGGVPYWQTDLESFERMFQNAVNKFEMDGEAMNNALLEGQKVLYQENMLYMSVFGSPDDPHWWTQASTENQQAYMQEEAAVEQLAEQRAHLHAYLPEFKLTHEHLVGKARVFIVQNQPSMLERKMPEAKRGRPQGAQGRYESTLLSGMSPHIGKSVTKKTARGRSRSPRANPMSLRTPDEMEIE
jgi:hypothetical protein